MEVSIPSIPASIALVIGHQRIARCCVCMQMNGNIDGGFYGGKKLFRRVGRKKPSHVFYADRVAPHLFDSFCVLHEHLVVVDG